MITEHEDKETIRKLLELEEEERGARFSLMLRADE